MKRSHQDQPEKPLTKTAAQRMARQLIAYLVAEGHFPPPREIPCHECAEALAATYALYVYPVCRTCRRDRVFVLGDVEKIAAQIRGRLQLQAGAPAPGKKLLPGAAVIDGEYVEEKPCRK